MPEVDSRFNALEAAINGTAGNTTNGLGVKRLARVQWNATTQGTAGAWALGASLPAGAIILRDYFYVDTLPVATGAPTLALSCETANNIFSAAGVSVANGYSSGLAVDGVSTGASTAFKKITSACSLNATVASGSYSAGKLTLWVEYVVHD